MPKFVIVLSFAEERAGVPATPFSSAGMMLWRGSYVTESESKQDAITKARADFGMLYRIEAHELSTQADTAPFFHWDKAHLLDKCCSLEKDVHHARLRGFGSVEEMASAYDALLERSAD